MPVLPSQRHLFDIPNDYAYFNCAYYSPQLNESRARLQTGAAAKSHPWERTPDDFLHDTQVIRELAGTLFGGDADSYAIIPAASYGLSTAARAIEPHLRPGDGILCIEAEFPSNFLPWQRAAMETGASMVTVPEPADGNWTQAILDRIDRTIRVVAVSSCHWTNGAFIDLMAVGKACREVSAVFAVDATQTLGAMPLSIRDVRPDFLVASGYKWLLGPYGFGLAYVSEPWRNARPLEETWLARDNAEDFTALTDYSNNYLPGSRRFDVGETCTPTILPGALAGLEQIRAWGVANIAESLAGINDSIAVHLEQLGFQLQEKSQRCPHMFGARLPQGYHGDLVAELKRENIYISRRGNALRFAPHLHISNRDIDRLLASIDHIF